MVTDTPEAVRLADSIKASGQFTPLAELDAAAPTPPAQPAVAQGAGEVVSSGLLKSVARYLKASPLITLKADGKDIGKSEIVEALLAASDTQPAAGADVLDALEAGKHYANEALGRHDQEYQRHPATEPERGAILADIAAIAAAIAASGRQE